ncbi:hypothetical protein [Fortiea contorta]|uniref:hypothetical protein n=1 Tax=Fortiea contorta TaxID=1892405 RepID=UPI000348FDAD|nr:hypothetical protein [Fortiea contorta]
MFTREELTSKSIEELQQLARDLGVEAIGNCTYPGSWIVPLLAVTQMAMQDCEQGRGMKIYPHSRVYEPIQQALDVLGRPTPHQMTLVKGALRGVWVRRIDERHVQQRLLATWQVRMMLLEALSRLR